MTPGQAGRVLLAVLLLPAMVAGVVPWLLAARDPWARRGLPAVGSAIGVVGLSLLAGCVRHFWISGRGTLAPWDPPRRLVATGAYRFTRNPMYVAVLVIVGGWAVAAGSPLLAGYLLVLVVGFHLRVVLHEEPWLARQFGTDWHDYASRVPRWLPRRHPAPAPATEPGGAPGLAGHGGSNDRDS